MLEEAVVTVTAFGEGRYHSRWREPAMSVADVLGDHGLTANGRRVALNGHRVDLATPVVVGDELTLIPRVQGV